MAEVHKKRTARALSIKEATKEARRNLLKLTKYARRGDFDAALALYRLTSLGISSLRVLTLSNDIVYKVARDQKKWPVLFSSHRDSIEDNKKFVQWIGLGSETGSNFEAPRAASARDNPAIAVVENLHAMAATLISTPMKNWTDRQWIPFGSARLGPGFPNDPTRSATMEEWGQRGAGSRLPKLSKSTARLWADATDELFELVYGDSFDEHPDLADLKDRHRDALDSAGVKNSVSAVSRAMRKAVKQAWRGYAPRDN